MDLPIRNNPQMDITRTISENMKELMADAPGLDTIKKLSLKSKVGFGTVQRARNGTGNITVQNLEAIAHALGKTAIDLITQPMGYGTTEGAKKLQAGERKKPPFQWVKGGPSEHPLITEVTELMRDMDEAGKGMLTERARVIAEECKEASKANSA